VRPFSHKDLRIFVKKVGKWVIEKPQDRSALAGCGFAFDVKLPTYQLTQLPTSLEEHQPERSEHGSMTNDFPRFDLTGKTALVTGAARGLGRAISLALAHAGADVALGLRDVSTGRELAGQIGAMGRRALPLQMDMTRLDEVSRAVDQALAHFGSLDILMNNAGLGFEDLAENVKVEDFDLTLAVNLKGTFFASQAAARVMIRQQRGCIVNMASQAGFAALPTESVYCMTKAALVHLTRCLAIEWGKHGIRVNAVAPTFIRTPGTEPALANGAFRSDVIERIAGLHRIGEPMDVAGAVIFLASPAASLITGHTILVDGGWTAR
jgi:NAD(P)-dependent dehydrogenase (short-subunit alcohol dehydrogenase family)